jgi:hypothetical protein
MGGKDVSEQKPSQHKYTQNERKPSVLLFFIFFLNRIFLFYKGEKEKRGGTID